jgi:tetratricopeptide (TPR) repeat protein
LIRDVSFSQTVRAPSSRRIINLLLLAMMGISPSVPAAEPRARTALVVGNARYEPAVGKLRNTDNDAKAVAATLRTLGFAVIERHNLNRDQLLRSVDDFRKTLPGADIALFYYAGHGISVAGSNYLVPIKSGFNPEGAEAATVRMLAETHLFNPEQVVAEMSAAGARCNITILDACRNTPLNRTSNSRSITGTPGLVEMTPPTGSLIAFATDAGRIALDGDGKNGLYTEELLKNVRTPGLTIEQVFKRTRAAVIARSEGGQVPAEYSRLIGEDIYLAGKAVAETAATPASSAAPSPTAARTSSAVETNPAALTKLATAGQAAACIEGLKALASTRGPGDQMIGPLNALLDRVKEDLKNTEGASTRVLAAAETCQSLLQILPVCLPKDHPLGGALAAKAHNRRGDALLLLGRADEAIAEFDQAAALAPDDAYVLYNRGRANLAIGKMAEAKADFSAAASDRFKQPKARKLALGMLSQVH